MPLDWSARRVYLRPFEAAFILQRCGHVAREGWSERALRNALRRAERGGEAGHLATRDGACRRSVTVSEVNDLIRGDPLAEAYLRAIALYGAPCPRAAHPSDHPPSFLDHLWLLREYGDR